MMPIQHVFECHVTQGGKYSIALSASDIETFSGLTLSVTFDHAQLQLLDIAEQAHGAYTTSGAIHGTDIDVKFAGSSEVRMTLSTAIPPGKAWAGVITVMKFKALVTGTVEVNLAY